MGQPPRKELGARTRQGPLTAVGRAAISGDRSDDNNRRFAPGQNWSGALLSFDNPQLLPPFEHHRTCGATGTPSSGPEEGEDRGSHFDTTMRRARRWMCSGILRSMAGVTLAGWTAEGLRPGLLKRLWGEAHELTATGLHERVQAPGGRGVRRRLGKPGTAVPAVRAEPDAAAGVAAEGRCWGVGRCRTGGADAADAAHRRPGAEGRTADDGKRGSSE